MAADNGLKSRPLLLVPTELERRKLLQSPHWNLDLPIELCGFGPIAAAARAAELLARRRERGTNGGTVWLMGIAGTFDPAALPVGTATSFGAVTLDGVGVGAGSDHRSAASIGFSQWPGDSAQGSPPIGDRIELASPVGVLAAPLLLTVCAAAANRAEADQRRARYRAAAEDMEAFGVALACVLAGVSLTVLRGISNQVGDRDPCHWRIDEALAAVARLASDAVSNAPAGEQPA